MCHCLQLPTHPPLHCFAVVVTSSSFLQDTQSKNNLVTYSAVYDYIGVLNCIAYRLANHPSCGKWYDDNSTTMDNKIHYWLLHNGMDDAPVGKNTSQWLVLSAEQI